MRNLLRRPTWSRRSGIFLLVVLFVLCFYGYQKTPEPFRDRSHFVDLLKGTRPTPNGDGLILLWTTYFRNINIWPYHNSYDKNKCPWKCEITTDKSRLNKSHVILFNARDLYTQGKDALPRSRDPNQIWLLHNTEPPWWTWLELTQYPNVFNWTSFPRADSDVHNYHKKIRPKLKSDSDIKEISGYFQEKTRLVVWVASNCHSTNHRETYVRQLRHHIPLHTFGRCVSNIQGKLGSSLSSLLKPYKFYLAFENGNCRDYITEKFWRSLTAGVIPVVMGDSAAFQRYAPPNSYIDSAEFSGAESLAQYLSTVAGNETLYRSYFKWRAHYEVVDEYWCELCQAVHQEQQRQVYRDLHAWFLQDTCRPFNWPDKIMDSMESVVRFLTGKTHFNGTFRFS